LHTGREIRAHFTNIQIIHFDPSQSRLPQDFAEQIDKLFPEKYSFAYYQPRSVEKRKRLNERAKALQREQEYLDEMPLAQRFPSHQRKSHGTKIQTEALNQPPNLRSIKITLDPSSSSSSSLSPPSSSYSQIKRTDNPLDDSTYNQMTHEPLFDANFETDFDTVEQNFDPSHLANDYNKQFLRLIHTQNIDDDPNDHIYNRDDLQDEPHFSRHADFQTDDNSQNDSQFLKNDTHRLTTKAQIYNFFRDSNEQNVHQQHFSIDQKTQKENQNIANDTFRSHDDREKVMANDEAFGALDFQHDDIQRDADDLMQQLLPAFSDNNPTKLSLDAGKRLSNPQTDSESIHDIFPNDILPNAQTSNKIKDTQLESDVEDRPHTETEPQLSQQRDNVLTVDPVPESRYNLRNKNRQNPYTFSGKVSEKWTEAPRRTRRRARSLDQKS